MSGTLIALLSGVGFGLFQTVNRRTVQAMEVYLSTFLLLLVSTLVLSAVAVLTEDVGLLLRTPWPALANFAVAAFIHFFVGWTLLNASQKRIGAARTTLLLATVPLFATVIAAVALREIPSLPAMAGVALVVLGVYVLSAEKSPTSSSTSEGDPNHRGPAAGWPGLLFGLGAALCWSVSPVFIRHGLRHLPSPLLGLTFGLVPCVIVYGAGLFLRRGSPAPRTGAGTLALKVVAGTLVGVSQWGRWIALKLAPVGVVLALTQTSVPVVVVLSPLVVGRHVERVTARVWFGALVIVSGALLLIRYQ
jgi:drug/metabolite transporter (DMT)-like permease